MIKHRDTEKNTSSGRPSALPESTLAIDSVSGGSLIPYTQGDGKTLTSEYAKEYAKKLAKKIKSGIKEIRRAINKKGKSNHGSDLIACLSPSSSFPHPLQQPRCTLGRERRAAGVGTQLHDAEQLFLEEACQHEDDESKSAFRGWRASFNSGSSGALINHLGFEKGEATQTEKNRGTQKQRRDFARLIHCIVYRYSNALGTDLSRSEARLVYVTLAGMEFTLLLSHSANTIQPKTITALFANRCLWESTISSRTKLWRN
jgi:hypothetical protein